MTDSGVATIRHDCARFNGYRPCPNDTECEGCEDFVADGPTVLLCKLYQLGNIVKTTPVLHALHRTYPDCRITWLASAAGAPLLANNPLIERVMTDSAAELLVAQQRRWDLVLGLESDHRAAAIAQSAVAERKVGIGLLPTGKLWPLSPESEALFHLSISDRQRFEINRKPVHELVFEALGVPYEGEEYAIFPSDDDVAHARRLRDQLGLGEGLVIGLNTGVGSLRFASKLWPPDRFAELAGRLCEELGARVVLLGGPLETELNERLSAETGDAVVNAGCSHTLPQFCAILAGLSCVVACDTFALQAAVAMETPVVGLFGPTPTHEIPLFGRGAYVVSDVDCGPCYTRDPNCCPRGAECMKRISVEEVFDTTVRVLDAAGA